MSRAGMGTIGAITATATTTKRFQLAIVLANIVLLFALGLFLISRLFADNRSSNNKEMLANHSGAISAEIPQSPKGKNDFDAVYLKWGEPHFIIDPNCQTRFLVAFKDAWYSDEKLPDEKGKRRFYIVYSCKNLGPHEGCFSFKDPFKNNIRLMIDKNHVYSGENWFSPDIVCRTIFGDWEEKKTKEIDATSERAIVFDIPDNLIPGVLFIGLAKRILVVELPQPPFRTKECYKINPLSGSRIKG